MSITNEKQAEHKQTPIRRMVFLGLCAMLGVAVLMITAQEANAVRVSLKRIIFDETKRSEILTIINNTSEPKTYRLGWKKYVMDEAKALKTIEEGEVDTSGVQWADKMVRYAPRRITVAPGGTQQIRLLLRRPKDMQEGEYRSHLWIVTEGKPTAFNPDPTASTGQVKLQVQPAISLPIFVRHGELGVETSISNPTATKSADGLAVAFTLNRSGNRSIYGDVDFICTDQGGEVIHQIRGIAVYTEVSSRNLDFDVPGGNSCNSLKIVYRADPNDKDFAGKMLAEATTAIN